MITFAVSKAHSEALISPFVTDLLPTQVIEWAFCLYTNLLYHSITNIATEMTNYNVEFKDLQGEMPITREHIQNNKSVRQMLGQRGIRPEELPVAEDIKKIERRVASKNKKIEQTTKKLPNSNLEIGNLPK